MDDWFIYGLPAAAALLGLVGVLTALRASKNFDRKYGRQLKAVGDLFDRQRTSKTPGS